MQMARQRQSGGMAVRMICALALLCLGLAHKMPVLQSAAGPISLAYQLPDGTAPALCVADGSRQTKLVQPDCDACRPASSTVLPQPPFYQVFAWARVPVAARSFEGQGYAARLACVQMARGPPWMNRNTA